MAIDFRSMRSEYEFEEMCRQLVLAENPNATPVEAAPGDEGMDAFEGVIDEEVKHIWQFKHFPHGIHKSQRDQIRGSLKMAIQRHNPSKWTLFTSTDLGPEDLRWLRRQKRDFHDVKINVASGTKIRELLVKHQGIRKQYFALQDEKTDALMRLLAPDATGDLPKAAILRNVRNDVALLNDNSPYFKYTFSFGEDGTRIGVEPRVQEADGMTMAKVRLEFPQGDAEAAEALERYKADVEAGRPVVVPGRFVTIEESVFDSFMGQDVQIDELRIIPKLPDIAFPMRICVSHAGEAASIAFVDMHLVRRSRTELEFSNEAQTDCRFMVKATFREEPPAKLEVCLVGVDGLRPSDAIESERFLGIMGRPGAMVTLESLSTRARATSSIEVAGEAVPEGRLQFYEDLLLIEQELDPGLVIPEEISEADIRSALGIARALRTGRATKRGTASVIVVPNDPKQLAELAESGEDLTWITENGVESFELFGRLYEFDFDTEMTGPANILEDGLEDGGVRVGIEGEIHVKYRNGRRVNPKQQ